ncbi:MAG: hydrogenase formation protein HypD [Bacteroidota bacterium]
MKYIDEYRNKDLIKKLVNRIYRYSEREYALMEVCGTHTMAINRFGIPSLLPSNITLKSGPGCPVCVTGKSYIDQAIEYARMDDVIVCSYGDLLRVPGTSSSLYREKAAGCDVRVVYSLMDALRIARENPYQMIVFLAIGFETTAPGSAVGLLQAEKEGVDNFSLFSAHKLMPPAMNAIVEDGVKIDGYICPGHVSTITGKEIYTHIPEQYGLACVISGFEPLDILQSILMLLEQLENRNPKVEIQYKRAVRQEGNLKAREYMHQVFEPRDDWWRGLGILKKSGLGIRKAYKDFDAEHVMPVEAETDESDRGCICGDILKGLKDPMDCKLFGTSCTPVNPVGACMVSSEGACQAFYKYRRYE